MIETSDSNQHTLVTIGNLGQAPSQAEFMEEALRHNILEYAELMLFLLVGKYTFFSHLKGTYGFTISKPRSMCLFQSL